MPQLQLVKPKPVCTDEVYIILGRAAPIVEAWLKEARTADNMVALLLALRGSIDFQLDLAQAFREQPRFPLPPQAG